MVLLVKMATPVTGAEDRGADCAPFDHFNFCFDSCVKLEKLLMTIFTSPFIPSKIYTVQTWHRSFQFNGGYQCPKEIKSLPLIN
jgi:hypothetical protein